MGITKRIFSTIGVEGVLIGGTALIKPEWLAEHAYWFIGVGLVAFFIAVLWDRIIERFQNDADEVTNAQAHIDIKEIGTGHFEGNEHNSDAPFLKSDKVGKLTWRDNKSGKK